MERSAAPQPLVPILHAFDMLARDLSLIVKLNGVSEIEQQLAYYPDGGAGYDRHVDACNPEYEDDCDEHRRLTAILYLNDDWQKQHGGALRLWPPGSAGEGEGEGAGADAGGAEAKVKAEPHIDIAPIANRVVVFMSSAIEHQVCASFHPRVAITTWFY